MIQELLLTELLIIVINITLITIMIFKYNNFKKVKHAQQIKDDLLKTKDKIEDYVEIETLKNVNDSVLEYLHALGTDDFGENISVNFMNNDNEGKGKLVYLTDKEINSVKSPLLLHKYLLKIIFDIGDYIELKYNLPEKLHLKLTNKITNKSKMIKFINEVIEISYKLNVDKTRNTVNIAESMMAPLFGSIMNFDSLSSSNINKQEKPTEEITELEKEMLMITNE